MSDEERSTLIRIARVVPWATTNDMDSMMDALKKPLPRPCDAAKRRDMQHLAPALFAYFTEAEWSRLLDQHSSPTEHQSIVFHRMQLLGGRCVAEPTMKAVASMLLYLQMKKNKAAVMALPTCSKLHTLLLSHVKMASKALRYVRRF